MKEFKEKQGYEVFGLLDLSDFMKLQDNKEKQNRRSYDEDKQEKYEVFSKERSLTKLTRKNEDTISLIFVTFMYFRTYNDKDKESRRSSDAAQGRTSI